MKNKFTNPKRAKIIELALLLAIFVSSKAVKEATKIQVSNPFPKIKTKSNVTLTYLREYITNLAELNPANISITVEDPSQAKLETHYVESYSSYQEVPIEGGSGDAFPVLLKISTINKALESDGPFTDYAPYIAVAGSQYSTCFMTNLNRSTSPMKPVVWLFNDLMFNPSQEECRTGITVLPRSATDYALSGFFDQDSTFWYKIQNNTSTEPSITARIYFENSRSRLSYQRLRMIQFKRQYRSGRWINPLYVYSTIGNFGASIVEFDPEKPYPDYLIPRISIRALGETDCTEVDWMNVVKSNNMFIVVTRCSELFFPLYHFSVTMVSNNGSGFNSRSLVHRHEDYYTKQTIPGVIADQSEGSERGFFYEVIFKNRRVSKEFTFVRYKNVTFSPGMDYKGLTSGGVGNITKTVRLDFWYDESYFIDSVDYTTVYETIKIVFKNRNSGQFSSGIVIFSLDETVDFGVAGSQKSGGSLKPGFIFKDQGTTLYHYRGDGVLKLEMNGAGTVITQKLIVDKQVELRVTKPNYLPRYQPVQLTFSSPGVTSATLNFDINYVKIFEEFNASHTKASRSQYQVFSSPNPFQFYHRGINVKGDFIRFSSKNQIQEKRTFKAGLSAFYTQYDYLRLRSENSLNSSNFVTSNQLRGTRSDSVCSLSWYPSSSSIQNSDFAVRCKDQKLNSILINANSQEPNEDDDVNFRRRQEIDLTYTEIPCGYVQCFKNGLALISGATADKVNETERGYILMMKNQTQGLEYKIVETANFKGLFSMFDPTTRDNYRTQYLQEGEYSGYLTQIDKNNKVFRQSKFDLQRLFLFVKPIRKSKASSQYTAEIEISDQNQAENKILNFSVKLMRNPNHAPVFIKKPLNFSDLGKDNDDESTKVFDFKEYFELYGNGISIDNPVIAEWTSISGFWKPKVVKYASLEVDKSDLDCDYFSGFHQGIIRGKDNLHFYVLTHDDNTVSPMSCRESFSKDQSLPEVMNKIKKSRYILEQENQKKKKVGSGMGRIGSQKLTWSQTERVRAVDYN